jgi:hypothetical protein
VTSTDANRGSTRDRIQNQRIAEARRKRNVLIASTSVVVVLAVLAVLIGVRLGGSGTKAVKADQLTLPPAAQTATITSMATSVPVAVLTSVGAGTADNAPHAVNAPKLMLNGKPEVLYVGAEYCPFCAAQRWPLVVALSRFGSFHGLGLTESSSDDVYPNTHTFTFAGSTYTSGYLSFVPVETQTRQAKPLETLTAAQKALVLRYDLPGTQQQGAIPFTDFGGERVGSGSMFPPTLLHGLDWSQIASSLDKPTTPTAKAIDGAANTLTAVLCRLTDNQPRAVCDSPLIARLESGLT